MPPAASVCRKSRSGRSRRTATVVALVHGHPPVLAERGDADGFCCDSVRQRTESGQKLMVIGVSSYQVSFQPRRGTSVMVSSPRTSLMPVIRVSARRRVRNGRLSLVGQLLAGEHVARLLGHRREERPLLAAERDAGGP